MFTLIFSVSVGALFATAVGFVARRVLGVPIGWIRTFLVGIAVFAASSPIATQVGVSAGLTWSEDFESKDLWVAAAFIVLAFAWTFAIGVLALVTIEIIFPTGSIPNPVQAVRDWTSRRRRTKRYLSIMAILSKNGLGHFLRDRKAQADVTNDDRTARALVNSLNDAGVTFIKLGQMLSTRRDLLPETYVNALSHLQNNARPEAWEAISEVIETELGRPIAEVFLDIDENPLAAASVAQVHRGHLLDGSEVVVKVQRPNARKQVVADVDIIRRLAEWFELKTAWGRDLGAIALADGFAKSLHEELDYRIERRNMEMVRNASLSKSPTGVQTAIPEVHVKFSTSSLLVMEHIAGPPLSSADETLAAMSEAEREHMAADIFETVLRSIMVHGVFHADLHPGNLIIIDPTSVGYLDFGSVGILDRDTREKLAAFLMAISRDDNSAATDAMLALVDSPDELDQGSLQREIGIVLTALRFHGEADVSTFLTLFGIARDYHLGIPPNVAAAFRAMATLDGALAQIQPGFELIRQAQKTAPRLAIELYNPAEMAAAAQNQVTAMASFGKRLPHRLEKIASDLETGSFGKRFRPFANQEDRSFLSSLAYDAIGALLAVAAVIGAIILMASNSGPWMTPTIRFHTFLGYVLAFFGFILVLRTILRVFLSRSRRR